MSIEVIPASFSQPFDPLDSVDHDLTSSYIWGRLNSGKGIKAELQRTYAFNRHCAPELVGRLISYGQFVEVYDEEHIVVDETFPRVRAFNAGMALALTATSMLAFELDVDQFEWRRTWVDLPDGIDAPLTLTIDEKSTPDDYAKVASALMDSGHSILQDIETPYKILVNDVDQAYFTDGALGNTFKASFGYVFGIGRKVIRDMIYEQSINEVVARDFPENCGLYISGSVDKEFAALVEQESR